MIHDWFDIVVFVALNLAFVLVMVQMTHTGRPLGWRLAFGAIFAAFDIAEFVGSFSGNTLSENMLRSIPWQWMEIGTVAVCVVLEIHWYRLGRELCTQQLGIYSRLLTTYNLQDWPRPADDNGIGMHFGLDVRQEILDYHMPLLAGLKIKWVVFYVGDEIQAGNCVRAALRYGITPILRPKCKINGGQPDWEAIVWAAMQNGAPAYVQIFNEPGNEGEWNGHPNHERFVYLWRQAAQRVAAAGGYPGLQTYEEGDIRDCFANLDGNTAARVWVAAHSYGINHPPVYPYDQGLDIFQDDVAVLNWLELGEWARQALGFNCPVIATEGGWFVGTDQDNRYPQVTEELQAKYTAAVFNQFRGGVLANEQALPDWLFAFCPWIWSSPDWDSWFLGVLGTRQQVIDAVKAIPEFMRQFTWDHMEPGPTIEEAAVTEALNRKPWMPVNHDAALWKEAQRLKLEDAQTDELEFTWSHATYVLQVFNLGILYCKKGDTGKIWKVAKPAGA